MAMLEDGSLIGTAADGGAKDSGVVFKLTPPGGAAGAKAKWSYSVVHDFCSKGGDACTDGASPYTNPIMDAKGNLYATTNQGGIDHHGVLYQLVFNKSKGAYTQRTLHKFCSEPDCADGYNLYSGVVMDGAGNLFGAASFGGSYGGVIYELVND